MSLRGLPNRSISSLLSGTILEVGHPRRLHRPVDPPAARVSAPRYPPLMRRAFFYGWVVVAVTAIVVLITAGVRSAPGAFLLTMTGEPGWSTASVSFAAA